MHAEEEDAGIETIPVFGGDEMDVGKFGRWKEGRPRHLWVQDDGVGVEPAVEMSISILS